MFLISITYPKNSKPLYSKDIFVLTYYVPNPTLTMGIAMNRTVVTEIVSWFPTFKFSSSGWTTFLLLYGSWV